MNKTTLHLVFAFALLGSLTVGLASVDVAEANFFIGPYISIISPVSWRVYTNTTIPLEVMASIRADAPEIVRFFYSVDAHSNLTLGNLTKSNTVGGYEFYASSVLKDLAQGNHTLNVYSQDDSEKEMFTSVEFMIDTNFLSPVSMLSPKNITYTTSNVSLTVLCSEKINWAYYRLDDIDGAPTKDGALSENFTLIGLSIGTHKVSVDVGTVRGPFTETVYFSAAEPEPFPTALVVGSGVAVAAVGLGLFVYFKKRRLSASDLS